jgi:3-isopropylmalate dehydrogenase
MKAFVDVPGEDLAVSLRVLSRRSCRRIIIAAFDYAKRFGYKSVTICEKPNVLRETSGMMVEEARKVSKDYSGIGNRFTNIDAQLMWLTKNPEDYDVIVATNLFGDILSDAFAGLVGGMGFVGSANIGEEVAIFEPTHGSAPKYANLDPSIVNPIGMILSACMMLEHLGEMEKSERIINGLREVVAEGKVRTCDMLRLSGGPHVVKQGAATTAQMTDAIIDKL